MITRQLHWVSSELPENITVLNALQRRMTAFYAKTPAYYDNINFTSGAWCSDPNYLAIIRNLSPTNTILEVGCGRANILSACRALCPAYTGADFSPQLLQSNLERYPEAQFVPIVDAKKLPFADASFDRVFCAYVLEHCVFPQLFLRECLRVLRPGGLFMLVCPDFLRRGQMSSQRAGFAIGNGREKLRHGKLLDAVVTGFDRKVRIPLAAMRARSAAQRGKGGFWINLEPTCFEDEFYADADAVYLTYDWEIIKELQQSGAHIETIGADPARIFLTVSKLSGQL